MNNMEGLYQNKYRTHSIRLDNYNYSDDGYYFITLCTDKRKLFFGRIEKGKMILNKLGEIVRDELLKTPKIRRNIKLDVWVIMPNHIHVVIVINNEIKNSVETHCNASQKKTQAGRLNETHSNETHSNVSLQEEYKNKFGPQKNNLSSVVRGFKGITTKRIHKLGYKNFKWQAGYYDHIIRDDKDLDNIREYIDYNPDKWQWDRNNPKNF